MDSGTTLPTQASNPQATPVESVRLTNVPYPNSNRLQTLTIPFPVPYLTLTSINLTLRQHPSRPSSADHTATTLHHHRPRSATAAAGTAGTSATMDATGGRDSGDGVDVNCAASHTSSDLGQLSHQSNQQQQPPESAHFVSGEQDGDGDNDHDRTMRPSSRSRSSNVIASMLLSGKSIDNQHNDINEDEGAGLGLGD